MNRKSLLRDVPWWASHPIAAGAAATTAFLMRALGELERLPARLPTRSVAAIGGSGSAAHETSLAAAGFRLGLVGFRTLP